MSVYEELQQNFELPDEEAVAAIRALAAREGSLRDVGCDAEGKSVLFWAALHDRASVVEALVQAGATLEREVWAQAAKDPLDRDSALHVAAKHENLEILTLLLGAGGGPLLNSFDYISRTPLHIAAAKGSVQMVRLLLDSGADPNAQQEEAAGDPPLACASDRLIAMLLAGGADPRRRGWMLSSQIDRAARSAEQSCRLQVFKAHLGWSDEDLKMFLEWRAGDPEAR